MEFHAEATSHKHCPRGFFSSKVIPALLSEKTRDALDIGSGEFCSHAIMLSDHRIKTAVTDIPAQIKKMNFEMLLKKGISICFRRPFLNYDFVMLNYVLNVIPEMKERKELLDYAIERSNGLLMVSVRGKYFEEHFGKKAERHNDGFILERDGLKTFNKAYEESEIENILLDSGLNIIESGCNKLNLEYLCRKQK